jgi:hypothetical protein
MRHLGYYLTSGSRTHVRFGFSTHAAAGANVAPNSAFEAADIRIYKATDGAALSATQRSSANGITMTSPFDSLTGVHTVDIDLTDNTDSGFYASGCYYEVWLCPDETVDSQTITGVLLGYFEIGVPTANVTQLLGTAWLTPGTAGTPDVNVKLISSDSTAADNAEAFFDGTGYAGTNNVIPTVTTLTNLPAITANWLTAAGTAADFSTELRTAINGGDYALSTDANGRIRIVDGTGAGELDTSSGTVLLRAATQASIDAIEADTNELQADWVNGGRLDLIIDDILTDTGTTLQGELDGIQADTEDIQSRLPAALTAGGNMKADALAISGSTTAADNAEIVYATDFATNYSTTTDKWQVEADVTHWFGGAINSAYLDGGGNTLPIVNAAAISGDETAADTLELFAEALDQTTGQLDSGSLANGTLTAAAIAADAFTAAKFAADVTTELQSGLATAAELAKVPKSDGTATWNATALASINTQVDTALADYDGPTNAELSTALAAADDAVLAAVATISGNVDLILADTGTDGVVVASGSKTGYSLASTGLDQISASTPTGVATTFATKMMQLWARFFGRVTKDSDEIKTYRSDGTTVATTQTYTSSGDDDDVGAAS